MDKVAEPQRHIFVPLAREPFDRFAAGWKTVEIRNVGSPVERQVRKAKPGTPVTLSCGYGKARRMKGSLGSSIWADDLTELSLLVVERAAVNIVEASHYVKSGPIVAFEVKFP